jgi:predicted nucleic acid-binding Zn finger protein
MLQKAMKSKISFHFAKDVKEALNQGKLSYELYKSLLLNYGKRGEKAFFYVKENRIKKYKDFFVVIGEEEYIVEESFCTCKDFQINLRTRMPCAHILAVKIAKEMKLYDKLETYYVDYLIEHLSKVKRDWR